MHVLQRDPLTAARADATWAPATPTYDVGLAVAGRPVTVFGGGTPALGHIAALRQAGAEVTVVATATVDAVTDLADRGVVTWERRAYRSGDLERPWLAVAATGDVALDQQIADDAEARRLWCVRATHGPDGSSPDRLTTGEVVLVGGGPGDPGLLTVAGAAELRAADVVICDRLAPLAALTWLKHGAEVIDVAKIPRGAFTGQEEINRLLVEHAGNGRRVVRLKGGDSFIFGRGGEELQACAAAGVPVRVIPGVSSSVAAPALAGIPLTHRGVNQGFTVLSGHVPPGDPRSSLDYTALARSGTALVLLMAVVTLPAIADALIAGGLDRDTPAATIAEASLPSQHVVRATVATIAAAAASAGIGAPAITVIGSVAAFHPAHT